MTKLQYKIHELLQNNYNHNIIIIRLIIFLVIYIYLFENKIIFCMIDENNNEIPSELINTVSDIESQEYTVSITIRPSDNDVFVISATAIVITYILYLSTIVIKANS